MPAWAAEELQNNCETLRKHFTKPLTQVTAPPSNETAQSTLSPQRFQVMAVYDLIVVVGCALLYSLPTLWTFYNLQLYPRVLPWILPAVQGRKKTEFTVKQFLSFVRGDVLMTSALRGEGGSENLPILQMNSTDRLREMQMKGGGGVKKSENIADVLCTCPLNVFSHLFLSVGCYGCLKLRLNMISSNWTYKEAVPTFSKSDVRSTNHKTSSSNFYLGPCHLNVANVRRALTSETSSACVKGSQESASQGSFLFDVRCLGPQKVDEVA